MTATIPYQPLLLWLLLLCSVAIATASADSAMTLSVSSAAAALESLDLAETTAPRSLSEHLLIHKETPDQQPNHQLNQQQPNQPRGVSELQRVLSLPLEAWVSGATSEARGSNFIPVILWMLGAVQNRSEEPIQRWLVVEPWRLRDVRLFVIDPATGEILDQAVGGQRIPLEDRVIPAQEASFPLKLDPGQSLLLVLRIQDKTFSSVAVTLHDPQMRASQVARLHDAQVALLGFVLAIVLVLLVQAEWRYALVAFWLAAATLFELIYLVPLLPSLVPAIRPYVVPILTASGALAMAAFALMTLSFLRLYRNRLWLVLYGTSIAIFIGVALSIPWTDQHHLVRRTSALTSLAVLILWPLAAWSARAVRHRPYGRSLLLLFSLYWVVALIRVLLANGLPSLDLANDPLILLYLFGLVSFALGVVGIDSRSRRDLAADLERQLHAREEAERQRSLKMQQQENATLAAAVEQQTSALREANARALADSAAKSNFLSTASHELRAPLHDLLGYAELLSRSITPEQQAQLAVIQKSGQQLLQLIDDILEFSRGDAKPILLEPTPLSLSALAGHLEQLYRPLAERGGNRLDTQVRLGESDWVIADERRLTQILRNLLGNACKFTQQGRIELRISQLEPATLEASYNAEPAGHAAAEPETQAQIDPTANPPIDPEAGAKVDAFANAEAEPTAKATTDPAADPPDGQPECETDLVRLRFEVSDTGIGIPTEQQAAIFEPFKRLDRYDRAPGLGLGLAISQQLALAIGGRIQVHSQPDQQPGSLFSIELQVPKASIQEASPARITNGVICGYRGPRRTLLIADDMPSSRQFLSESARAWGFDVLLAVNGADALEQLQGADPKPDAALIDQFMPQLDGWGFLRQVRESSADATLPVILISAAPLERPETLPSEITFDAVALKPLSVRTLAEILEQQLALDWDFETRDEHAAEDPEREPAEPNDDSVARALAADIDDEQLAELRKLLSLGAVIAIADWARERCKTQPESAALWHEIERRAIQIDLEGLRSLARQGAPSETL
ncbi:MAG: ATP-binding protein [Lamprobacter sp.]|uniref:hybrid sensor histidine kinase/response regulator n=1 Tax=Lamprobacter sp. TaxID=3100796 RepID=UPI002B25B4E8|nr:ATP-binding protein [Lamprobacter sp.]MEA3639687.1 ATP-binding protein [Lamprobacter sp.]